MLLKQFFCALIGLLVGQLVSADPELCPQPENAKLLVYSQNVAVPAPQFGRAEEEYVIPNLPNPVTCVTVTGDGSAPASISSVGLLDDGSVKIKLVSSIQQPINVILNVYAKE